MIQSPLNYTGGKYKLLPPTKFFDCEKNHFSGKNSRSVIGTVHHD